MCNSIFKKTTARIKSIFNKEDGLLDVIKKEVKIDKKTRKNLIETTHPLWMPSTSSTLKTVGLMAIAWLISHPTEVANKIIFPVNRLANKSNFYEQATRPLKELIHSLDIPAIPLISPDFDPIAIHAGVGAILVGLVFFVAGSLLDKEEPEKGRVLLYKSNLFPLLIAETLAFFFFIGETNWLAVVWLAVIAIFTLISFGRVVDVLIHLHKLEEAKKDILLNVTRSAFIKLLDRDITKRVWFNCLYKHYQNSEILNFSPFGFWGDNTEVFSVKSPKDGYIQEVKVRDLEKLVAEINRALLDTKNSTTNTVTTLNSTNQNKVPVSYMRKSLHDKVGVDESIFEIKKDTAERIGIRKIQRMVLNIFKIEKDETESEARVEISKLKDRCIAAIKEQSTGELEKIIRLYVELINEFFKYLNFYGGGFTAVQAKKERGAFFERLKPLEWISRDIREIFEKGIDSEDINIIRDVAYLPILLAQEAIESKDHLVFQEFLYFPCMLYEKGFEYSKKGNEKAADIMFDRTWRYLKELSVYHLESKLKDEAYPEQDFKDYSIHILKIFQELLKSAFDKRDIENFEKFLQVVMDLFDRLGRQYNYNKHESIEEIYNELNKKRQEMIFGLTSWILFVLKGESTNDETKRFYTVIQNRLPSQLEELTEIFLRVHDFKIGDYWGWDWWESRPDEGVHTINTLEKLEQLFIVKSLSILRSKTEEEITAISLPHNRDLAFLAEGTREVMKTIEDIENNPNNWNFVLDEQSIAKCANLRTLLEKAHEQQEQDDLRKKRETPISKDKVEKFKKSLVLNYEQSHPLKTLLKNIGSFVDKTDEPYNGEIKKMGINTLFDKAAFFGDDISWHVHHIGIDEAFGFGRNMAYGENKELIEAIDPKTEQINKENFEEKLSSIKTSNIIIIATNRAIWNFFERGSDNYIPKWNQHFPQEHTDEMVEGVVKYKRSFIPVYEIFTPEAKESNIYILDKTKIGKLIQYSPLDKNDPDELIHNVFLINIRQFEKESEIMKEFLNKPPEWLTEKGDKEKQIEYLQEQVLIHIFERYEFQLHKKFMGYKITLNDD